MHAKTKAVESPRREALRIAGEKVYRDPECPAHVVDRRLRHRCDDLAGIRVAHLDLAVAVHLLAGDPHRLAARGFDGLGLGMHGYFISFSLAFTLASSAFASALSGARVSAACRLSSARSRPTRETAIEPSGCL